MASIYTLTEEFNTILALMEEGAVSEEVLQEVLENTQEELSIKLEGYCKFIKNCQSDMDGLDAEIKRLTNRKQVLKNTVDNAKSAMKAAVIASGGKPITCGTFKVSLAKNPPKLIVDDPYLENIPACYLIPKDPELNKDAIKEALTNGSDEAKKELEGIAHLEQGTRINIR